MYNERFIFVDQRWDRARSLLDASTRAAGLPPHGVACDANVNANLQESNIKVMFVWLKLYKMIKHIIIKRIL